MTTRGLAGFVLVAALAAGARADDGRRPDARAFDKQVIDSLRAVHNVGADLYNEGKDFAGAYRVYQGALLAVRPLLDHRPDAQKLIDAGLETADKEADPARRAFVLHEAIEAVRKNLKTAGAEPKKPEPKPETPKPEPKPDAPKKVTEPPAKKPEEPKAPTLPVAPPPRAKSKG